MMLAMLKGARGDNDRECWNSKINGRHKPQISSANFAFETLLVAETEFNEDGCQTDHKLNCLPRKFHVHDD